MTTDEMLKKVPLLGFAIISAIVLALIFIFYSFRIELLVYKMVMASTLGPLVGMLVHYFAFPNDRNYKGKTEMQLEHIKWRRVALMVGSSFTIGVGI